MVKPLKKSTLLINSKARYEVLENLYNRDYNFSLRISKQINRTFCHIVRVAQTLEKHKLIKSYIPSNDTRVKRYAITKKGKEVFEKLKFIYDACQAKNL